MKKTVSAPTNVGGGMLVRLEFSSGQQRYRREPAYDETPERIFERRWALSVLDRVVEKLREEFVQHGHRSISTG